jgi:hypothetical protein
VRPFPEVTDPTAVPRPLWPALDRVFSRWVHDPRDTIFVRLSFTIVLVLVPLAVLLFVRFHWLLGAAYLAIVFGLFIDRYTLMLHCVSHRPLYARHRWLNQLILAVMGPLMGQTPNSYYGHHIGMHHPENNLFDDLSTTMPYQRDSFLHFLRYWARFFFRTVFELPAYLRKKGRHKLARRTFTGEFLFHGLWIGLAFVEWRATLVVLLVPFIAMRILMMCGNWGQHAFIDPARPANPLVNSITCINTRYNRRCFNDGYHIGHHVKANRHWTEMPTDFLAERERYAREGAIVFDGIDFFQVWMILMLGRYDWLADRVVHLGGPMMSRDEVIALLRSRTRPIGDERTVPSGAVTAP